MTEKKSQSKLPLWVALGFLVITIFAAYYYQTNKATESPVPAASKQDTKNATKEVTKQVFEPNDDSVDEESFVSEIVDENVDNAGSKFKELSSETEAMLGGPLLKTVLVETDGAVVMAGTGLPNQKIDILLDDNVIETVIADERGDFAILFDLPYSTKIRVLSLKSEVEGVNSYSPQEVIISPAQIAESIATTQADSDESGIVTKLQPSSDTKDKGLEPQITEPDSAKMKKIDDRQQKANEKKLSTSDMVIADSEFTLNDNNEPNLNEITEEPTEIDVVQETQPVAETVTSIEVEDFKDSEETTDKVDLVNNKNTKGKSVRSMVDVVETTQLEPTPVETTQLEPTPVETTQLEPTPVETTQLEPTPVETTQLEPTPVETTQLEPTPVETTQLEPTPVETTQLEPTPVETTQLEPTPVETTQLEPTPVETTQLEPTPVETTQLEPTPVETTQLEPTPVETTQLEPTPVETTQLEPTPVETTQLEPTPVETTQLEPTPVETTQDKITSVQKIENLEFNLAKKPLASRNDTDTLVENRSDAEKAPVVMITDNKGVRVIQSGAENSENDVALDTISYDDGGEVNLAGRGKPAGYVRIYLDNTPVSTAVMDSMGQWNTALSQIDPGVYTLRLDQLDPRGQVSSRLEMPFKRESLETLQAQLLALDDPARINVVTVQPGNTLWAIARERYGLGILYVRVFQANRDKIRDENLIYPGQIFELPD